MTSRTNLDLDELRKLCDAATCDDTLDALVKCINAYWSGWIGVPADAHPKSPLMQSVDLLAKVPDLIAEVERLRAELADAHERLLGKEAPNTMRDCVVALLDDVAFLNRQVTAGTVAADADDATAAELRDTARARDEAVDALQAQRRISADLQRDIERLTRERDKARDENARWRTSCARMVSDTAEAIAAWLRAAQPEDFIRRDYGTQSVDGELFANTARMFADAIRAGRWRP